MRNRLPDHYRTRIILLLIIIVGIFSYIGSLISDRTFDRAFTSLITLRQDNVSEIRIFDGESSQEKLLVKKSGPKDNEVISEFVRAINSAKPIEIVFYPPPDCGETVYIKFVAKPGGARSEADLYNWLNRLGIWNSLACD